MQLLIFAVESGIAALLAMFAAFLLTSGKRTPALFLMSSLSLAVAAMVAGNLLISAVGWLRIGDAVLFLDLLTPALVFLYVREMRGRESSLGRGDAVHALPALAGLAFWESGVLTTMDVYVIGFWSAYLAAAGWTFLRHVKAYEPRTLQRFIVALIALFVAILLLRIMMVVEAPQGRSVMTGLPYLLVMGFAFIVACLILVTALRYPGLLSLPGSYIKYAHSRTSGQEVSALARRMDSLFRDDQAYRDADLTLERLATLLEATPRQVSQMVNTHFDMNVSAYVNQCRVRHAARLLVDQPGMPIKVVMLDSGFRSKSIFNREFQRHLGTSPSAYRCDTARGSSLVDSQPV